MVAVPVTQQPSSKSRESKCTPACKGALSPSQLDTYRRMCQRRWGFAKLAKLPEPEFKFQTDGIEVHAHLEDYLTHDTLPPTDTQTGTVAHKMLPSLPHPDPAHKCEQHLLFTYTYRWQEKDPSNPAHPATREVPLKFHGVPDLRPKVYVNGASAGSRRVGGVVDFKTISVGRERFRYVKEWDTLSHDSQALVYGMYVVMSENVDLVHFKWIYAERSKPFGTRVVEGTLKREEIIARFEAEILPAAWEMRSHKFNVSTGERTPGTRTLQDGQPDEAAIAYVNTSLHPNVGEACEAYGGCPFLSVCKRPTLNKREAFLSAFAQHTGSPRSNIMATTPTRTPPAPGQRPAPKAAPVAPSILQQRIDALRPVAARQATPAPAKAPPP
jgi:hypothetical protein